MSSLLYLYRLKAKGFIRKLFSRTSSIILMAVIAIFIIGMGILMQSVDIPASEIAPFEILLMMFLGFSLIMMLSIMMQKRTAYFYPNDANILFVGPFKQSEVILYGLIGSLASTLLFAIMVYGYTILFFSKLFVFYAVDFISFFFISLLLFYNVFAFIDMIYIRLMSSKHQTLIKRLIVMIMIIAIALIFGYYYFMGGNNDFMSAFMGFVNSNLFSVIPVVGWSKMALLGFHYGDLILGLFGTILNILLAILLTYITISTEKIDVEIMVEDANYIEELKVRQTKNGSNLYTNLKIHEVKGFKWGIRAKAIRSRLMLEMRKTRSFITRQEIMLIALYLVISIANQFDFAGYSRYVTIILFTITMSANYVDELKHQYIYLIPDKPIRKLLALLEPTFIKLFIVIMVMLLAGLFLKPTPFMVLSAFFEMAGYGALFVSANIWSLKVLKSSNNQVTNQFIKMLLIVLAALPSIAIGIFFNLIVEVEIFSFISSLVNILVACIFIYISKGIISKDAFIED